MEGRDVMGNEKKGSEGTGWDGRDGKGGMGKEGWEWRDLKAGMGW